MSQIQKLLSLPTPSQKKTLPTPLLTTFEINSDFHTYNTRNRNVPRPAQHKTAKFNNSYLTLCPRLWSTVPNDIKTCKTVKTFKMSIKKWKISDYQKLI